MSFSDIKAKEKIISIKEFDGKRCELFVKQTGATGACPQYMVSLAAENSGHNMGFAYFFVNESRETSSFIGMKIEPKFRGRSYGNLLVSSYIDLCDDSDITDLDAQPKQRKPEIVHILKKFGYGLKKSPSSHKRITLVHGGEDSVSKLYIPDSELRRVVGGSKVARDNNYSFVSSLEGQTVIDEIYYGHHYYLTDRDKCLAKQEQVRNHFGIHRL
jgi:hypothetical protein